VDTHYQLVSSPGLGPGLQITSLGTLQGAISLFHRSHPETDNFHIKNQLRATTSAIAAVAVVVDNVAQAVVSCSNPGAQVGLPGSLWIFRKTSKFLENDPFPVPIFGHPMYADVFMFFAKLALKIVRKVGPFLKSDFAQV